MPAAVLFDLPARKFYVFGLVFWPQDFLFLALLLVPFAQRFQLNAQLLVFSAQGFHCLEIDAHPGTDLMGRAAAAVAMKDGAPFAEKGDLDEII